MRLTDVRRDDLVLNEPPSTGCSLDGKNFFLRLWSYTEPVVQRERESGVTQPLGGLLADEMGFGSEFRVSGIH